MLAPALADLRGALIDVDGTLLHGDGAIPGAAQALARLRSAGVMVRLTTNTTRRSRAAIAQVLGRAGIAVEPSAIVLPASLARRRILESGRPRAALLLPHACEEDFTGVEVGAPHPDWVVVGDLGRGFTFELLNRAFHWLREGASLIALQKNRFWHAGAEGILLDAGPFVAALEYAAQVTAEVVGKPSREFFDLALRDIGLPANQVISVGDSLENDVLGAARAGCRTALVRTGVYDDATLARSPVAPDLVLASIDDL